MNKKYIESLSQYQKLNAYEFMLKVKGIDITVCPCCGSGKMITKSEILPKNGSNLSSSLLNKKRYHHILKL